MCQDSRGASPVKPTYLHFECKVFLQVLDDHHQEWKFDAERFLRVRRTRDVGGADVGADDLQHQALDVVVGDALNVAVAHLFVPYLQRLAADAVQYGQKARLERVFEHAVCGS